MVIGVVGLVMGNVIVNVTADTYGSRAAVCFLDGVKTVGDMAPLIFMFGLIIAFVGAGAGLFLLGKRNIGVAILILGAVGYGGWYSALTATPTYAASGDCLLINGTNAMTADLNMGGNDLNNAASVKLGAASDWTLTRTAANTATVGAGDTLAFGAATTYISDTVPPQRAVTLVVCASDAKYTAQCDYRADGTADDVQINAALAALTSGYGCVGLTDGNYSIAANILPLDNTCLKGQSTAGTIITLAAAAGDIDVIYINAKDNVYLGYFTVVGAKATAATHDGITIWTPSNDFTLQNVWVHDTGDDCFDGGNRTLAGEFNYRTLVQGVRTWDCGGSQFSIGVTHDGLFNDVQGRDTVGDGSVTGDGFIFACTVNTQISNFYVYGVGGHGYRFWKNAAEVDGGCNSQDLTLTNLTADTVGSDAAAKTGFTFDDVTGVQGTNLRSLGNDHKGFAFNTGSSRVVLTNAVAEGNGGIGFDMATSDNAIIGGEAIDNTGAGINIQTGVQNAVVQSVRSYDTRVAGARTQTHGVLENGTADFNVITGNSLWNNSTANITIVGVTTWRSSSHTEVYTRYNVAAPAPTGVHPAVNGTGAPLTVDSGFTNPGIPRTIRLGTSNIAAPSGDSTVTCTDSFGRSIAQTVTLVAGGDVDTDIICKTIVSYTIPPGVSAADTVSAGVGNTLGLPDPIQVTGDVRAVARGAGDWVPEAVGTVDATYWSVTFATLNSGDEVLIQYRTTDNRVVNVTAP